MISFQSVSTHLYKNINVHIISTISDIHYKSLCIIDFITVITATAGVTCSSANL